MKSFYTPLGRQGSRLCATGLAAVLVASMVGMSVASMWGTRAGPARQGAFIARPSLLGKRRATEVMPARVSYTGSPFIAVNHTGRPIPSALALQEAPVSPAPVVTRVLPDDLPPLTREDLLLLKMGERVQHQIRNGCMGSGYVVVDVKADAQTVWNTLLNFDRYADMIPTIRGVQVTSRFKNLTKGIYCLSKFRFRLSVVHRHRPDDNRLEFFLDPDADQYGNILEMAEGFWYIDDRPSDRPAGWTRVYMTATVKVNSLVPLWLVEYAADRALKRATAWLKPWVESSYFPKR